MARLEVCTPGQVPFTTAWHWQHQRVARLKSDPDAPDSLLLLTHPPVYTLGTGSDLQFLNFDPDHSPHELQRVERGGEVTYHGPGQWVGYPIFNLKRHQTDLHWYLRQLEQVIIDVLAEWDLKGERIRGLTGVWLEGVKVAAIGIKVSRWISFHGFALNVCPDLQAFEQIVPCGIPDRPVGSLIQFRPDLEMNAVSDAIIRHCGQQFGLDPRGIGLGDWLDGK